jgi:serine O-acetyltransferase
MRRVLIGDLLAAAERLCGAPVADQWTSACRLIDQAHAAHRYARRFHRPHPRWGDGSLMARAMADAVPVTRAPWSAPMLQSLSIICHAVRTRREFSAVAWSVALPSYMLAMTAKVGECSMAEIKPKVASVDPVWNRVCDEAVEAIRAEPLLGGLIHSSLLHHSSMERALAYRFSQKLASGEMSEQILREIADEAYAADPELGAAARADVMAVFDRDPACHRYLQPILFFKGYQAVQAYRIGHWLWETGRKDLSYFVQMRVSEVFGVDIHPAARVGKGIMIDHAHSIVIGETAVVGDNVSMLHSVTLGGTGKEDGDRHPKIGNGVLIGAGAKVLGNITIGHCSRIAAGSVVLHDVPPCKTVAGVPAKIIGEAGCAQPAVSMDHRLND